MRDDVIKQSLAEKQQIFAFLCESVLEQEVPHKGLLLRGDASDLQQGETLLKGAIDEGESKDNCIHLTFSKILFVFHFCLWFDVKLAKVVFVVISTGLKFSQTDRQVETDAFLSCFFVLGLQLKTYRTCFLHGSKTKTQMMRRRRPRNNLGQLRTLQSQRRIMWQVPGNVRSTSWS